MLSPVSPSPPTSKDEVGGHQEEQEEEPDLSKAMLDDPIVGVEAVVHDQHGPGARKARPLPTPKPMSAAQKEIHDLTHLPFDEGCDLCRLTRGLNALHRLTQEAMRTIPLRVADSCYLRWSNSAVLRTVLVMRL